MVRSLWNFTDTSATLLSGRLSNCKAVRTFNTRSCAFETLQDPTIRRLIGYWKGPWCLQFLHTSGGESLVWYFFCCRRSQICNVCTGLCDVDRVIRLPISVTVASLAIGGSWDRPSTECLSNVIWRQTYRSTLTRAMAEHHLNYEPKLTIVSGLVIKTCEPLGWTVYVNW